MMRIRELEPRATNDEKQFEATGAISEAVQISRRRRRFAQRVSSSPASSIERNDS
jgi:hypothetical protein